MFLLMLDLDDEIYLVQIVYRLRSIMDKRA